LFSVFKDLTPVALQKFWLFFPMFCPRRGSAFFSLICCPFSRILLSPPRIFPMYVAGKGTSPCRAARGFFFSRNQAPFICPYKGLCSQMNPDNLWSSLLNNLSPLDAAAETGQSAGVRVLFLSRFSFPTFWSNRFSFSPPVGQEEHPFR